MGKIARFSVAARGATWSLSTLFLLMGASAQARADLQFAQPLADAGEVHAGAPLRHRFAFTNNGTQPVELIELRASCGCLRPHVEKRTYLPGEGGEVLLEVHTLGQSSGPHTWRVTARYTLGDAAYEIPLQLIATVITEVSVQPAAVTVFAESAVGHEILLTDLRQKPLSISAVETSSPKLKSRVSGTYTDEYGRQVRKIQIELAADYPEGRHEEVVDILTDDPGYRDLRVPVTIVKRSPEKLSVVPAQVSLTAAPGQEVASKIVLVRTGGNQAVVVDRVDSDDPAIVCQWARGPGVMTTVRINVDRAKMHGNQLHATVRVHVREPAREILTIPVTCILQ